MDSVAVFSLANMILVPSHDPTMSGDVIMAPRNKTIGIQGIKLSTSPKTSSPRNAPLISKITEPKNPARVLAVSVLKIKRATTNAIRLRITPSTTIWATNEKSGPLGLKEIRIPIVTGLQPPR